MNYKIFCFFGSFVLLMGSLTADCCCNYSIYGDWLYWNVRKCGLDYVWPQDKGKCAAEGGVEQSDVFNTTVDKTLGKGNPKHIDPSYDSGFRVDVNTGCGCWDFGARYTYYRNCESDSFTPKPDTGVEGCIETPYTPSRLHPDQKGFVDRNNLSFAKSNYDVDLDVIDIEAGRFLDCPCPDAVRFFGGVKLAFIDEELKTRYEGGTIETSFGEESPQERIHNIKEKVDMDAYGLYAGFEGHWDFCDGFGLFGKTAIGTLYAEIDRSFFEEEINDPSVESPVFGNDVFVNVHDTNHCLVNHLEFATGVHYHCSTNCGEYEVQVGYELHSWWNTLGFMAFVDHHEKGALNRSTEGLGFDGLFVRLNVGF